MFNWLYKLNGWLMYILACVIPTICSILYSMAILNDFEYISLLRDVIFVFLLISMSSYLLFLQLTESNRLLVTLTIYNIKNHILLFIYIVLVSVCFYIINDSSKGVVEIKLDQELEEIRNER